jgi:arylsulfatase A-like enzyme
VRPVNGNPQSVNFDWGAVAADDRAMGDGQVVAWSQQQLLAETGNPRFNAVGIYRPHLPWYLPQKYFDLHPLDDVRLPATIENDLDDISEIAQLQGRTGDLLPMELHKWVLEAGTWREGVRAYLASISFADAMLGQLLDALERSGRANNTIIVLWSDHGWHLGEKARWRKHTLWHDSTHVPLIVVAPGVTQPASRSDVPVSLMDLYPTLTELAGLETPGHVEGQSLVPLLEDPQASWERDAVVTTFGYRNHAVTGYRYRYLTYSDGSEELYDLETDPNEWTNRADDPALEHIKAELAAWLPRHDEPDARGL